MTVVFPNWEGYIPNLDDEGFLTYDSVNGGSDEYYDRYEESFKKYNFTNLIFKKFVKKNLDNSKKDIII